MQKPIGPQPPSLPIRQRLKRNQKPLRKPAKFSPLQTAILQKRPQDS